MNTWMKNIVDKTSRGIVDMLCDMILIPESGRVSAEKIIVKKIVSMLDEISPHSLT